MDSIMTPSETRKEQLYRAVATAFVITAGLLFVAPFLVVVAGFALALIG